MSRPVNASEIVRNDRSMVFAGYVANRVRSSIAISTTAPGHFGDGFVSAASALSETSGRSGYL
jgi:hypothetical protein